MLFRLTLAAFVVIHLSLVFSGIILRDAENSETCQSEDCYTANHILKWLNPEADPCDDFYEFTCGNWKNLPVNERMNKSIGARDSLVNKFIPFLLKEPSATNENKHFANLRNFIITCMDQSKIQAIGVTPIKELIQNAGGWPMLDSDWSEEEWDFLNAEISLGGVLIDVDTTLYQADDSSDVTFLIGLGESSLIKENPTPDYNNLVEGLNNEITKAYYDTMVDIILELGVDKEMAEKNIKDVLEFEIEFLTELKNTNYSDVEASTLQEFQDKVPWIDLRELLEAYLPETYEILPEEMIIGNIEYFLVLKKMMNLYPLETFVNYMVGKAVYPLMKYVSDRVDVPSENGWNVDKKEPTRFDFCTNIVTDGSLAPALAAYLGVMYSDASQAAVEMTRVIIEELSKEVKEYDWMDSVTKEEVAKNISMIKTDVGFSPKVTDLNELDKLYEGYEIDPSNFFKSIIYDKKWIKQKSFDVLHKEMTTKDWGSNTRESLFANAYYLQGRNAIIVTGPMLYFVALFGPDNPAYVNYGHIGSIVAHELIHAVDLNAEPEEEYHMQLERWGNNRTENAYNNKKQCFIDFYSSINDTKTTHLKLNGTKTQREDMADNGGLKLSLRAYRKYAAQLDSPERKLPLLQEYTVEQLFMISVANAYCEIPYKEKITQQLARDTHSPNEFRVNGMMMNSPDFSEIFHCDNKDPMNPPQKCDVW